MKAYITNINVSTAVLHDNGSYAPENAKKQGVITVEISFLVNGNAQAFEVLSEPSRLAIADQIKSKLSELEIEV